MARKIEYPYEFDRKKRNIAKIYSRGRLWRFLIGDVIIDLAVMAVILLTGFNAVLANALPFVWYMQAALYFTVLFLIMAAISFPVFYYFGYVYEHKFGLSRHTAKGWLRDYLKSISLAYLFSLPVVVFLYLILPLPNWWAYAVVAYAAGMIFIDYIYPEIVMPIFYTLKPYRNKTHMKSILRILRNAGVKNVNRIYIANESQRSVKANAFFAGFGRTKHIVLFDTLVDNFTPAEVETVIGHELGHYVNKDIWRGAAINILRIIPTFLIIDFVLRSSVGTFGITSVSDVAALPLILLSYHILSLLSMPFTNAFSRRVEKAADMFALDTVRKPDAQISTEKRLADMALSPLHAHPLIEKWLYSHPKTTDRIKFCINWKKKRRL